MRILLPLLAFVALCCGALAHPDLRGAKSLPPSEGNIAPSAHHDHVADAALPVGASEVDHTPAVTGEEESDSSEDINPDAPVWPLSWNATLLKISDAQSPDKITWTKLYYSWPLKMALFDFYDHYPNLDLQWNVKCSVWMTATAIYFTFPDGVCELDHPDVGLIAPGFVSFSEPVGKTTLRGVEVDHWHLPLDDPIELYFRSSDGLPMRTTNQINDPGATDYFDIELGPQDHILKDKLPKACQNPVPITRGCPLPADLGGALGGAHVQKLLAMRAHKKGETVVM